MGYLDHHLEDLGIGEDIIKMDHKEMGCDEVDWIHLAVDRHQWRTVGNTV
jgi:hypothetical protein